MSAALRRRPIGHDGVGPTIRVTAREIREAATRALSAAGVSAGEASAAAVVITHAELHERTGLSALLDELGSVPPGPVPVAICLETLPASAVPVTVLDVTVLDDPARRGPLLIGRLAMDLCAAISRPVLVRGHVAGPAFIWTAVEIAERQLIGLELVGIGHGRACARVTVTVTENGSLYRTPPPDIVSPMTPPTGVLISRADPATPPGRAVSTTASRSSRLHDAMTDGIDVDAALWSLACAAARRFLVPENRSD